MVSTASDAPKTNRAPRDSDDPKQLVRVSIATKLSLLLAVLLLGSVASLAWLSTRLYTDDSRALIQQMTADSADAVAGRFREIVERAHDRLRLGAALLANSKDAAVRSVLDETVRSEQGVVALRLWRRGPKGPEAFGTLRGGATEADVFSDGAVLDTALLETGAFSLEKLFEGHEQVTTVRLREGVNSVALALPLAVDETSTGVRVRAAGAVLLAAGRFAEAFGDRDLVETFLVDAAGRIVASTSPTFGVGRTLAGTDLGKALTSGSHHNGQLRLAAINASGPFLVAFRKVGLAGLAVVAAVPEEKAFETARWVQYRAALLALFILCVALAMGQMFSGSLTAPIYDLVAAAARIARGDFRLALPVRTRDELGYLSRAFGAMAAGLEERDRVKATFHKFHDKEIADRLLAGDVALGGELREAAILFSDIRNFTKMSEAMEPTRVVEMLNEYMTAMVEAIGLQGGVVDKYIGDAILALWGVPIGKADDVDRALRACLAMRDALVTLNAKRAKRGEPALEIGMGLHFGRVVAGNIGSTARMEYTVIGDAVNTAARIEAATKDLGAPILVSQDAVARSSGKFRFGKALEFLPRGKTTPIMLVPLLGEEDAAAKRAA